MKTLRFLAIAACSLASASAAYVYDYSSLLNPYTASQWTQNGTITASTNMVTSSNTDGGSLILIPTVPGLSNSYEVRTTLTLPASGGDYYAYLRATSNALSKAGNGTWYYTKIGEPTFSGSSCSATLAVAKSISGTITNLLNETVPCNNGMVVRSVMTQTNYILVYINNVLYADVYDTSISSGQPGIGVHSAPSGNGITTTDIGHLDTVAPNTITSLNGAAFRDRVDLQWPAATDDTNGIGIAYYNVYRDGDQVAQTTSSDFSDYTATASNTYSYVIVAVDYHWNTSYITNNVTTPATIIDPREVGIRPTGSYWGGGGEEIDMRSGNLNYTLPMVKAMGRGGRSVGFNLTYNSQNWRQDSAGTWQLGLDTGYGYGWRLQAGSLTPLYSSTWVLAGYLFIDSTGSEYRLTVNSSGVWSSLESIYIFYDSTTGKLHFTNGSFWTFGSTSALTEQDAGTMYPTLMEDSNGNQVVITYDDGVGMVAANTSARISTIEDVRGVGSQNYSFTYSYLNLTDPFPHLTNITNRIGTMEKYNFTYADSSLISPFDHVTSFGTFAFLQTSTQHNLNANSFTYDSGGSGELNQVTTPYGGHLRWTYAPYTLATTLTYREVQNRYLSMASGATETLITLVRGSDSIYNVHQTATLDDAPANSEKYWTFQTSGIYFGLQAAYEERTYSTHTALSHLDFTWAQTPTSSNPYIGATVTKLDPGQTYEADKQTVQTLDQYGNMLTMNVFNFGNLVTPVRTYTNTYGSNSNYAPYYLFGRLLTSTVTDGTNSATLVSNTYDATTITSVTGLKEHDDTNYPATFVYRGNVTNSTTPTSGTVNYFDMAGNITKIATNGVTTNITTNSTTNFAAPSQMTTNTLTSSMTWSGFLGLSSATDPNNDSGSISYTDARPTSVTSPYGAVTTYGYFDTALPPSKSASTNGHSVNTYMDGFGRTIQTTSGASTTLSILDTQYAPCGCSPLGKLSQQSQPYAPGGSDAWTVYHYDASGRTTSVVLPDGSTTAYLYTGNIVKVTDPAGHWKQFTMDGVGNLVQVTESDPTLGSVATNYTYDVLNHLTGVSMPRGTTTQTRTFNYTTGHTVGAFLLSATNPESGTVTYTYNTNNLLASKTDAKSQQLTYQYDTYNRLTSVTWGNPPLGDLPQVLRTYYYDTNPLDSTGFSQNTAGRLTAVQYTNVAQNPDVGTTPFPIQMNDMYSYIGPTSPGAGLPAAKRLQVNQNISWLVSGIQHQATGTYNLDSTYTYNNEGKLTAMTYPTTTPNYTGGTPNNVTGASYNYSYDTMYRLAGMTSGSTTVVNGVSYNAANELLGMTFNGIGETRSYNVLNQLTNVHAGSGLNLTYNYPTGTDNGKISSMYNAVSGETVTYTYDSLNRLATAGGSGWGEAYTFDPFGNLTTKTVTAGSGPSLSVVVNETTNRIGGTDANGNMSIAGAAYDVENHIYALVGGAPYTSYAYDAQNKRVFTYTSGAVDSYGNPINYLVVLYSPTGQKMGTYQISTCDTSMLCSLLKTSDQYFGGRRLASMDQLGSVGTYYPWGEAKGTTNPQDAWSYATYWRDSATGLDYANNRYYTNAYGRFMTPDPYIGSAKLMNPGSWNRYAYANNDPANRNDPSGLDVNCGFFDGEFMCIDTTWGEIEDPDRPLPWWTTLDQFFQSEFQSAVTSALTVKKSYADVQPCSFSATQVISYISNNFSKFSNFTTQGVGGLSETVTFNPPAGPLVAGESIPITIQVGASTLNTSVTVETVTANSISFATTPGHLLYPGAITFSATQITSGEFAFNIDLNGVLNGPANIVKFLIDGSTFEDAEWNNFLGRIGVLCNQLPITPGG